MMTTLRFTGYRTRAEALAREAAWYTDVADANLAAFAAVLQRDFPGADLTDALQLAGDRWADGGADFLQALGAVLDEIAPPVVTH